MTANQFRSLALSLPETAESSHMNHPDFRVAGKIFATLGAPDATWGMVKLTPDLQTLFIKTEPGVFDPASGAWGRRGCTMVRLKPATVATIRQALIAAWRITAPKKFVKQFDEEAGVK